jgi:signal peptidase II
MAASTRFLILTVGVGVVLLVLVGVLLFARSLAPAMAFAFALIAGGGLGNLYDRLTNTGRVVDFLMVGMGSLRTGIFNVADLAITFGVGLFVLAAIQRKRETGS